jgi:formylglycine-generating enzyme required for sulfatase activity
MERFVSGVAKGRKRALRAPPPTRAHWGGASTYSVQRHAMQNPSPARPNGRLMLVQDLTQANHLNGEEGVLCTTAPGPGQICLPSAVIVRGSDGDPEAGPSSSAFVDSIWMDRHEVRVRDFRECVALAECTPPISKYVLAYYRDNANLEKPIVGLSWTQMNEYCRYAGGRLPTETEWERAARGAEARTYPWGATPSCGRAHWAGCGEMGPVNVGSFPTGASPEGVVDLIGNVFEATSDRDSEGGYRAYRDSACNPAHPLIMPDLDLYVVRGCSYMAEVAGTEPTMATCTGYFRSRRGSSAYSDVGFRCVRAGR